MAARAARNAAGSRRTASVPTSTARTGFREEGMPHKRCGRVDAPAREKQGGAQATPWLVIIVAGKTQRRASTRARVCAKFKLADDTTL